ncbi:catenin alpha-2-like [Trichosurus vulpecula]|uniref:catenin alpha-2-like n=1 Tax=Trichosurus vulpecula TaxID=9337 RepID=UPI00186AC321|nr:catenin alpha-2-like [Trichosurus vulpecula]
MGGRKELCRTYSNLYGENTMSTGCSFPGALDLPTSPQLQGRQYGGRTSTHPPILEILHSNGKNIGPLRDGTTSCLLTPYWACDYCKPVNVPEPQGETMRIASSEFADDPCSSVKRGTMVRAARALLSAVTRLLILADMADVMRLLSHLKIVEEALEAVKNATNEQDLANRFKEFGKEMVKLNYVAARRQQELKDPHCRDEMAAARGALKKNATMLYTASQAFLRHPDVAATRANRDYVFKQVQEAIAGISNAAQATSPTDENKGHTGIGELAAALNEFDNKIILDPMTFSEARFRPSLEERLESIISGAALMADSSCTRDDRRERIVAECNAVRQALQDLLSEYMNNGSSPKYVTTVSQYEISPSPLIVFASTARVSNYSPGGKYKTGSSKASQDVSSQPRLVNAIDECVHGSSEARKFTISSLRLQGPTYSLWTFDFHVIISIITITIIN